MKATKENRDAEIEKIVSDVFENFNIQKRNYSINPLDDILNDDDDDDDFWN